MNAMIDSDFDEWEAENTNLRRHFRVMGPIRAWRAFARMLAAGWLLLAVEWLMSKHISSSTARALDNLWLSYGNDCDIAHEGWTEAGEIADDRLAKFLRIGE